MHAYKVYMQEIWCCTCCPEHRTAIHTPPHQDSEHMVPKRKVPSEKSLTSEYFFDSLIFKETIGP